MTIGSLMSRMGTAEKLSVAQIQQAIKDGTLPAYVGIPMMQEKMKAQQAMQAQQGAQQQPSIAEQVMAQANAGIPQLESNLPAQGMAAGGIVALAGGGSYEDDTSDDDTYDSYDAAEASRAMDDSGMASAIMRASRGAKPAQAAAPTPYAGPGAGAIESIRSFFSKSPESAQAKPAQSAFHHALNFVLPHEGGYVNDKADKGGPTNYGVTKRTLESYLGKKVSDDEVQNMPVDLAKKIYKEQYWDKINGDKLDPKIAMLAFDTAVGSGVGKAKQMLEKYGDDPEQFLEAKKQWMKDIVKRDPSQQKFDKGWQNRMNNLGEYIQKLPSNPGTGIAGLAEGGEVAHFWGGGLGSTGGQPITADFMNESQQLSKEARLRLMREQARAAFTPAAQAAEAPAAATRGVASLLGRASIPLALAGGAYGIGNSMLDKKQAEEMALYGAEGPPTDEELARAAKPAWMRDVSMSPKVQQERGIKPLAPLTYTPAGVQTYGPRPGYTPPKAGGKANAAAYDVEDMEQGQAAAAGEDAANKAAFDQLIAEKQAQPMKEDMAAKEATKEPSSMDEYLKMLKEGYGDLKKQKEEDKYLALLAAGLGMMGGTSPFASANIGQGGLQGVQSLMASNKQNAAEKNALDRAYGQGLYRQGLGESTAQYKKDALDIQRGQLELSQLKELDSVLNNIQGAAEKRALAVLKTQGLIGLDTPPEEISAKVSDWASKDLARNKAYRDVYKKRWGSDYDVAEQAGPSYAGFKLVK